MIPYFSFILLTQIQKLIHARGLMNVIQLKQNHYIQLAQIHITLMEIKFHGAINVTCKTSKFTHQLIGIIGNRSIQFAFGICSSFNVHVYCACERILLVFFPYRFIRCAGGSLLLNDRQRESENRNQKKKMSTSLKTLQEKKVKQQKFVDQKNVLFVASGCETAFG